MPPPSARGTGPRPNPEADPGRRSGWVFTFGVVAALVLTAVVAMAVVLAARAPRERPSAAAPTATRSVHAQAVPTFSIPSPTPSPLASPTMAPSTSMAARSPTAAPQPPLPTAAAASTSAPSSDSSLKRNALYEVDLARVSHSCDLKVRRPKPPLANKKLEPYLTEVVHCLHSTFAAPLAAKGFALVEPSVRTYHKKVESPCGEFGQGGSPAYYCSTTSTIYWPDTVDDGREAYTFARLGYVGLVAHEYGHHLQATTEILKSYAHVRDQVSTKAGYEVSRRLELQAQCFEGVFLHANSMDLDVTSKDRQELEEWHSYTGDEDPPHDRKPDHGSSKAQFAWLARGLKSGNFADCNTWTASAKSVA